MNPIQTETKGIRPIKYHSDKNDLSYYTYLKDCRYQVRAHFIWNENRPELEKDRNENKHHNIAKRMIERGERRDIFLGTRECQGYVKPCIFGEEKGYYDLLSELSFGMMYHGITYADEAYSEKTRQKVQLGEVREWLLMDCVTHFLISQEIFPCIVKMKNNEKVQRRSFRIIVPIWKNGRNPNIFIPKFRQYTTIFQRKV